LRYLFLLVPLAGAAFVYSIGYNTYTLLLYLVLAFFFVLGMLIVLRGWLRDAALVLASILFCLVATEAYQVFTNTRTITEQSKEFAGSKSVLGWGALTPGSFVAKKVDAKTGDLIYDVTYTIDDRLLRKTISSASGPTIAFFGDSFVFGEGLPDAETLPQVFSDLEARKLRVLNFAFSGYGPQQFLRALEARLYDGLLEESRLFIYETAPWHAERTACTPSFMLRAPRYVLRDGRVTFAGACAEGLTRLVREVIGHSAAFRALVQPAEGTPTRADVDLYIATILRAVTLAREQYHVATLVLYVPISYVYLFENYLEKSGYTDQEIMQKLRDGGAEVIDGALKPMDYPQLTLNIPGDGHPTGAANRLWAEMIKAWWDAHAQTLLGARAH
jgi:lysophospholipase L1-like esterase